MVWLLSLTLELMEESMDTTCIPNTMRCPDSFLGSLRNGPVRRSRDQD